MFRTGMIYRHSLPSASLDILVTQVVSQDENQINLKVMYLERLNRSYRGLDEVRVLKSDLSEWVEIS